jgi:hypothetical protein
MLSLLVLETYGGPDQFIHDTLMIHFNLEIFILPFSSFLFIRTKSEYVVTGVMHFHEILSTLASSNYGC